MIEDISKEQTTLDNLKRDRKPLIDRMDETFKRYRGDKFVIPETEGKWESVTSNRAQAEGWKIANTLAKSTRIIFNNVNNETVGERAKINHTELLVNGLLYNADRQRDDMPETPKLQAEMAFYRTTRGWGAYRLMVMEDDDNQTYLDLEVWDPRNTFYLVSGGKLSKVYYERFVSFDQAKIEYPEMDGSAPPATTGAPNATTIVTVYDCTDGVVSEGVYIGSKWVKGPDVVEIGGGQALDHIPVRIKAGGPTPLIGDKNSDNIKKVGEDYLTNNRDLLDVESRLLSYNLSAAGQEAGEATVLEYDSTKNPIPKTWNKDMRDPRGKKGVFIVDTGVGQKVGELIPQAKGSRVQMASTDVIGKLNSGGLNPIAYGEGGGNETAFSVDTRNHNTREHIWPFRDAMQEDFIWMAHEIVYQFKKGSFKPADVFGYDSKSHWFSAKIKPEDISDNKEFKCKLLLDELSDKATNAGLAIQLKEAGVLPLRELLDNFQLSNDPDGSIDALAQEATDAMFDTPAVKGYLAKLVDYADAPTWEKQEELKHTYQKLQMIAFQEAQMMAQMSGQGPDAQNNTPGQQSPQLRADSRTVMKRAQPNIPREPVMR